MKKLLYTCLFFSTTLIGQVGINTTNPQKKLHIATSDGTLRIESLNSTNNPFNGGDANGDTDLSNDVYPLYVDSDGNFTLELNTEVSTGEFDAFDDTSLPNSSISLPGSDTDGKVVTLIETYSITVQRPSLLEVKYSLSFDVYLDAAKNKITDNLARRIGTYVRVTGQSRNYGESMKCYTNGNSDAANGTMFNSGTTYITLPSAGTYLVAFYGLVSSDKKGTGVFGTNSIPTYVEFATGNDFLMMRLH